MKLFISLLRNEFLCRLWLRSFPKCPHHPPTYRHEKMFIKINANENVICEKALFFFYYLFTIIIRARAVNFAG